MELVQQTISFIRKEVELFEKRRIKDADNAVVERNKKMSVFWNEHLAFTKITVNDLIQLHFNVWALSYENGNKAALKIKNRVKEEHAFASETRDLAFVVYNDRFKESVAILSAKYVAELYLSDYNERLEKN